MPVPVTVEEQEEVWAVVMAEGAQATATEETEAGGVETVTVAEAVLEASWAEVAVMVAVPAVAGVNTPELILPIPVGLTDQLTAWL